MRTHDLGEDDKERMRKAAEWDYENSEVFTNASRNVYRAIQQEKAEANRSSFDKIFTKIIFLIVKFVLWMNWKKASKSKKIFLLGIIICISLGMIILTN